jgi:hypothetical protein
MGLSEAEIKSLLDEDLDVHFYSLGQEISNQRAGIKMPSREKLLALGKAWLEANRVSLCKALGENEKVRAYANGANIGLVELFTAICDVVAAFAGVPSVATASAIIFKSGVTELCPEIKDPPGK